VRKKREREREREREIKSEGECGSMREGDSMWRRATKLSNLGSESSKWYSEINCRCGLWSISSTFYAHIFCTKVLCTAFFYLHVTREKLPKRLFPVRKRSRVKC